MVENRSEKPSAPPAQLRLYLLGPPAVEWAGNPLPVSRRQARALLFRLASRLQPVPREHLCDLLWPDVPEQISHRNLSHLLTHLRRELPQPDLLISAPEHIGLDASTVWSDAAEFGRLSMQFGPLPRTVSASRPRAAREERAGEEHSWDHLHICGTTGALQQAVALYRGPFLEGFFLPGNDEFDAWLELERCAWERLYLTVLYALMGKLAADGAYDDAIHYALQYLETDELAEHVHRRLMELYAAVGNRTAALRQFTQCTEALQRELGVEPAQETLDVYRYILEDHPPPIMHMLIPPAVFALPAAEIPLVGRQDAMQWLFQRYAEVQTGPGRVVLISGEAGVGKSRLIQHFIHSISDRSLVLAGQCCPSGRSIPYCPLAQALRALFSKEAIERARRDVELQGKEAIKNVTSAICASLPQLPRFSAEVWLAEASRLLPDLNVLYAELPPPIHCEPEEARTRLFEALSRLVAGLTNASRFVGFPNPVTVFLDDIHWADDATLAWLSYLGQQIRSWPLLVIGTYRTEEADTVAELRRNLSVHGVLEELKLTELDLPSILELLRFFSEEKRVDKEGDEVIPFASRLKEVTGGNPFFLLETLKALRETGELPAGAENVGDIPLPASVQEAVEERLRHLDVNAQQIIEAGAVLGLSFDLEPAALTAGLTEIEALEGLDTLVRQQLLEESPSGYRFHHELTQRVVEAL